MSKRRLAACKRGMLVWAQMRSLESITAFPTETKNGTEDAQGIIPARFDEFTTT